MDWEPVEAGAKNAEGKYMALKGGAWVPADSVAKNAQGQYMALILKQAPEKPAFDPYRDIPGNPKGAEALPDPQYFPPREDAIQTPELGDVFSGIGKVWDESKLEGLVPEGQMAIKAAPKIAKGAAEAIQEGAAIPGKIANVVAGKLEGISKSLMQSSIKPTLEQLKSGDAARAIDTMLKENISLSEKGVEKLRAEISKLNDEISSIIKNSPATVDKEKVAEYLNTLIDKLKKQVNPQKGLDAVKKSWNNFINHPDLIKTEQFPGGEVTTEIRNIPVQQAQEMKQGTYRELGNEAYGESSTAEKEAQKTLARGLKEQIAEKVPEVVALNKRESELINALDVGERRVLLELNKNPTGLATLAKNPKAALAFMADRSAQFKTLAAKIIYRAAQKIKPNQKITGIGADHLTGE